MKIGGSWTIEKLDILGDYLDAYTTALKDQPFELYYIDAFAGDGAVETRDAEVVSGSANRALQVSDRAFDRLIFIEANEQCCECLEELQDENPSRDIQVVNRDANQYIRALGGLEWNVRGVVFLDPCATQVDWATVQRIARLEKFDLWLLFPTMAIARMLPRSCELKEMKPKLKAHLERVYGGSSWRNLYQPARQGELFGGEKSERRRGVEGLLRVYHEKLTEEFGKRVLGNSRSLRNLNRGPLFELFFCTGSSNPKAIKIAHRIAGHLIERMPRCLPEI